MERVLSSHLSGELYMDMRRIVACRLMAVIEIPDTFFDGYEARMILIHEMEV